MPYNKQLTFLYLNVHSRLVILYYSLSTRNDVKDKVD